jgi:poly(3-hydroxybutyrate) depolymerase
MVSMRRLPAIAGVLVFLCGGCASSGSSPSGSGGASGAGGASSEGGTTGTGLQTGTGGRGGSGGSQNGGGTTGAGGSAAGRAGDVGGSGGLSSGMAGTGGSTGSAGHSGTGGDGAGATGGSGGSMMSGTAGRGGSTGAAGSAGAGAAGRGGSGGTGGAAGATGSGGTAMQSAGCGKTRTLQNGTINITVGGAARKYILRVPDGYDSSHAYRLVLAYAWSGASASQVVSANYFTFATLDSKNTIFAAPDAVGGAGSWSNGDIAFTDAILAQMEGDLCIDTTRVFATGFSFGGGMAMALACTRADVFRAVAFFSGADLTNSCPATLTKPIAYYASQASEDSGGLSTTSPITGERKQAQFAEVNGCMPEPSSTTFPASGQPHRCTIYKGCSAGHPTEYCVFNGPHGWEPKDPGQTTSWNAPEAWKFITQF